MTNDKLGPDRRNERIKIGNNSCSICIRQELRRICKSDSFEAQYERLKKVPFVVKDNAIRDIIKARAAHFAKLKKRRQTNPSATLQCQFKFRSRKDRQESLLFSKRDWGRKSGDYFDLGFTKERLKSSETLPEKLETDTRLVRTRLGEYYLCVVQQVASKQVPKQSETQAPVSTHGVVSLDPGVRTFQTCYSPDGLVTEWGEADMTKVFKYCYETDRLQKRIRRAKGNSSKKYRMRKALYRLYKRVRNLLDEVHKKLSKWL